MGNHANLEKSYQVKSQDKPSYEHNFQNKRFNPIPAEVLKDLVKFPAYSIL
jgi:hypothetical protein